LHLAHSQTPQSPQDSGLNERVIFVPRPTFFYDAQLETTVYQPATPGPWPLVVINHGMTSLINQHLQPRYRAVRQARYFLDRGYLVVLPMRQGFSNSTGVASFHCDHANHASYYGQDIAYTIDYFIRKGDVRADQILLVGQSAGGMVEMGYAAGEPRAKAFINFDGGISSNKTNCNWVTNMLSAAQQFGAKTHIPSLWIYAEDDEIFPLSVVKQFFDFYHNAGAPATLKLYPKGGHMFASSELGVQAWGPDVENFLRQVGLPADVLTPATN